MQLIRYAGWEPPHRPKTKQTTPKPPPEPGAVKKGRPFRVNRDDVIKRAKQGVTYDAIAQSLGCSKTQVGKIAREAGIHRYAVKT